MKVSAILFGLLVACQVMPATMRAAAAQVDVAEATRASFADGFGPDRLRSDYHAAVARLHTNTDAAMMLRRLDRSANRATGMPTPT